ncbi:Auxin response factor 12 [Platanthera zijinensis]|uniref:Auxin-responsive protein n=1 Tax=Platanthera zijinensis TaxID=2320716 RepID=A0AAP0G3E4_9ASPA
MRFRTDGREQGLPLMNFQSSLAPWIQQRFEPTMVTNEHDQYQFMPSASFPDFRGDLLKQQILQYQQPFQFQLQTTKPPALLQQPVVQQTPQQDFFTQLHDVSGNQINILQQFHGEQQKQQTQQPQNFERACQNSAEVQSLSTSSFDSDLPSETYSASCIQNSLYGLPDESAGLLKNSGDFVPSTKTFVKVYKSGSVGRSLDISRFSSYNELREELGHMFGIEGLFEDPLRSGWQLVFVDRENDVLLLGDGPWEAFVNSVWYIKILSPDDVQRTG